LTETIPTVNSDRRQQVIDLLSAAEWRAARAQAKRERKPWYFLLSKLPA
jgi:hypothetical protein